MKDYDGPRISGIWGYDDPWWWGYVCMPIVGILLVLFIVGIWLKWW